MKFKLAYIVAYHLGGQFSYNTFDVEDYIQLPQDEWRFEKEFKHEDAALEYALAMRDLDEELNDH